MMDRHSQNILRTTLILLASFRTQDIYREQLNLQKP